MARPQEVVSGLLPEVLRAEVAPESCPAWLLRPGRAECVQMWETVAAVYRALTGLVLPEQAPPRERRRLDAVLRYADGRQQILEIDERQHFTGARATTLECYPADAALGFDARVWLARSRTLAGREPAGGFAAPRPPLFPGAGGRHRQRAFRDTLADLLPPAHGWLPTLRISDIEVTAVAAAADPAAALRLLLAARGVPQSRLLPG
ncbi:hypothetical protein [Streptomyces marincola]|uniref:hypothetical protein n=1 Tax=Streptomyces marincola TaxID=2878388 RepID=UPI001CF0EF52|nr:hypothetical protein [Streptomyces marincola]UCM91636.1 hypothetical protein LC193_28825 [Streptomyces marincola]